jgi:hypothetical protein
MTFFTDKQLNQKAHEIVDKVPKCFVGLLEDAWLYKIEMVALSNASQWNTDTYKQKCLELLQDVTNKFVQAIKEHTDEVLGFMGVHAPQECDNNIKWNGSQIIDVFSVQ